MASDGKRRGLTPDFYRNKLITRLREKGIHEERVLDAMSRIPRHDFVDAAWDLSKSYEDTALPIGRAQTISQPHVVALMSQALMEGRELRHVLEVGTGCGYQTAILAEMVDRVYSVERIRSLHVSAQQRLRSLNYMRVYLNHGDGYAGWEQQAPFDGIIVTAAAAQVPAALLLQLAPGGRLIIPVGDEDGQKLCRITLKPDGGVSREVLAGVSFVPMLPEKAE
ncbi:MAG: protein-L-isoaspartate(D-aspartate) O-methyltransferase [Oceanococcus sp.]